MPAWKSPASIAPAGLLDAHACYANDSFMCFIDEGYCSISSPNLDQQGIHPLHIRSRVRRHATFSQ